jgi:poly(3-hydroxybutyrate) depolymerase
MNFSYQMYEMALAALGPARAISDASRLILANPFNPFANTAFGKNMAAGAELFERMTRRYGKPVFGFQQTTVNGVPAVVREEVVLQPAALRARGRRV